MPKSDFFDGNQPPSKSIESCSSCSLPPLLCTFVMLMTLEKLCQGFALRVLPQTHFKCINTLTFPPQSQETFFLYCRFLPDNFNGNFVSSLPMVVLLYTRAIHNHHDTYEFPPPPYLQIKTFCHAIHCNITTLIRDTSVDVN